MRKELLENVKKAKAVLAKAQAELIAFDKDVENNVYNSIEDAHDEIEDKLLKEASNDCEGSNNCGAPVYVQSFIVDKVIYIATLNVEYNRHDKQYYYIDSYTMNIEIV